MKQIQSGEDKTTFSVRCLMLLTVIILPSALIHPVLTWAATPNLILDQSSMPNPNPVAQTCNNFQHLLTVNQYVKDNDPRPLPANQDSIYVTEWNGGKTHLHSKSYSIPALAPGAHINMAIAVGTDESYRAHLPGLHMLYIHLLENGKEISFYPILVEIPKDFCQIRAFAPLSHRHLKANTQVNNQAVQGFVSRERRERVARPNAATFAPFRPTAHIPPPAIQLISETHRVDTTCANKQQLVTFTVRLQNHGGPLGAHKLEVWVEDDKGVLPYNGVAHEKWMPALMTGQMATVTIPVGVLPMFIGRLPGAHALAIGYYTTTTMHNRTRPIAYKHVTITLPQGICQPKLRVMPPAQMHPRLTPRGATSIHRLKLQAH